MEGRIQDFIKRVQELLASQRYEELEELSDGNRMSADKMRAIVEEYGRSLIPPPAEAYQHLDIVEVEIRTLPTYSVRMPLWTAEEGESDLSIELTITDTGEGFDLEIDSIHVF